MSELQLLHDRLQAAKLPEIFGVSKLVPPASPDPDEEADAIKADCLAIIKKVYRTLVKICGVDHAKPADKPLAEATFKRLKDLEEMAVDRVEKNLYGSKKATPRPKPKLAPVEVKSKKHTYTVLEPIFHGEISTLYRCTYLDGKELKAGVFKIVRLPRDNDLAENEIDTLKRIQKKEFHPVPDITPQVIDSFVVADKKTRRQAAVFPFNDKLYSMAQIIQAYPNGVDPQDAAWMINRLFEAMFFYHKTGTVHGALLPHNILYNIENHGIMLSEWSFAVKDGEKIKAINKKYEDHYPPEVPKKLPASAATDIYMAARAAIGLLGGTSGDIPKSVSPKITGFLRACLIGNPARRPQSAGELRDDFGDILRSLYGKRKFRVFTMPGV